MNKLSEFLNGVPKPIRDFFEGILSAGILGAGAAVLGLNLADPNVTTRAIIAAACFGFVSAAIAAGRRGLPPPPS